MPKLSSVDADMVLYDMYEVNYKIFNHIGASKKRPLSSVAMHDAEENTITSNLYEAIDMYQKNGIKEIFGLSLTEYFDLPTEICIKLLESASSEYSKKSSVINGLENDLKNMK
jgi:hypothetical protein